MKRQQRAARFGMDWWRTDGTREGRLVRVGAQHGLDPHCVLVGGEPVVVDTNVRTITYTHREAKGRHVRRTVQLEAPALPFPSEETR